MSYYTRLELQWNLGGDSYHALMVKGEQAEDVLQVATSVGLKALRTPEFAQANPS